jgi:hypothetical protein
MHAITLFDGHEEGPEAGEHAGEHVVFHLGDPGSVRRAQAMLQQRFGLAVAPLLASEPGSFVAAALRRGVRRLLRGSARLLGPRIASDPGSA